MIVKDGDRFLGAHGLMDTPALPAPPSPLDGDRDPPGDHAFGRPPTRRRRDLRQVGLTDAWGDLMPAYKVTATERLGVVPMDVADRRHPPMS